MLTKIKNNLSTFSIAILGVIARFVAMIYTSPKVFQHDVMYEYGHLDYAVYIFRNWNLPEHNIKEFSQPPLNALMQAIVMKILSPFIRYSKIFYTNLYEPTKILSFLYSCITIYIIYKILKEFDLSKKVRNIIFAIVTLYPGIIIMSTQYSNDNISYMFFYLSLLLTIRWAKNHNLKTIILLAISIGVGMLSKISVGLIAFITGPMMLAVLIKSNDKKKIFIQLLIFAMIVFPLGLSYAIRNLILFKQPIGSIYEVAINTKLNLRKYSYTIFDRFLSIPLDKIFEKENGIYHNYFEYNVWIDLIKTSTFDEFHIGKNTNMEVFLRLLYIANIAFYIASFISIIVTIVKVIKSITIKVKYNNSLLNFRIICIMLFILAIFAYLYFNIRYPYSCNSNYRYISYITLAMAGCLATAIS